MSTFIYHFLISCFLHPAIALHLILSHCITITIISDLNSAGCSSQGDQHGDHVELAHALHCFSAINTAWINFICNGILYYCVFLWMASEFWFGTVYSWRNIYFSKALHDVVDMFIYMLCDSRNYIISKELHSWHLSWFLCVYTCIRSQFQHYCK